MRAIYGDAVEFEIEDYGDYIEVHLHAVDAVEQLEAEHDDPQFIPFNSGRMMVRRDR